MVSITMKGLQGMVLVFSIAVMRITWAQGTMLATPVAQLGTIVGIVMNSAKERVEGAVITATSASGIRSTISGSDGVYSFADVLPGVWSLTITVEGSADTVIPGISVVPGRPARRDIVMNGGTPQSTRPEPAKAAPPVVAAKTPPASAVPATIAEALQVPEPPPQADVKTPWAGVGYVGWMNGTSRGGRADL
jgi:hypothetical protein